MKSFRFENAKRSAIVTTASKEKAITINNEHPEMNLPFIKEEVGFLAKEGQEAVEYSGCSSFISFYDKEEEIGWAECID